MESWGWRAWGAALGLVRQGWFDYHVVLFSELTERYAHARGFEELILRDPV